MYKHKKESGNKHVDVYKSIQEKITGKLPSETSMNFPENYENQDERNEKIQHKMLVVFFVWLNV